ncbi:hypothetical protein PZ938_00480 [Luteipulveratus sp. YIM 133132]|uniref:PH domain-containing protein n=1 Tax=Luteipulveratus flavus TaxID=3031728 RepID=A0ABT6C438_9MICO|nr:MULTISPECIES: hypothetical protein [unclassified Luteipulveratus]MDE9364069.1 hypothetical protein [Luteipulveratus sp. YIM 133132]MDF8263573.1 hypothetical protein [Luteipulveratus sp. YIM 133296]
MTTDPQNADVLVHVLTGQRWLRWLNGVLVVAWTLMAASEIAHRRMGWSLAFHVALVVLWTAVFAATRTRITADANEIRPPERWRRIHWAEVAHIQRPGPYDGGVKVARTDGKVVSTGFPLRYAQRLAALGNVDVRP